MDKKWKYPVKSVDEIREKGLSGWYAIITESGTDLYTGMTAEDYEREGYTVLSNTEFCNLVEESNRNLCNHWKEITVEDYEYALNVLPPKKWENGGFFMSEFYTGSITSFFQEWEGKYYTSLQDYFTPREEILENLKVFIREAAE